MNGERPKSPESKEFKIQQSKEVLENFIKPEREEATKYTGSVIRRAIIRLQENNPDEKTHELIKAAVAKAYHEKMAAVINSTHPATEPEVFSAPLPDEAASEMGPTINAVDDLSTPTPAGTPSGSGSQAATPSSKTPSLGKPRRSLPLLKLNQKPTAPPGAPTGAPPTPTPSPTPAPGPSPTPTPTPTPGPAPTPTPTPGPGPGPAPTPTPTPGPGPAPTPTPTPGPGPGPAPTPAPTPAPGPTPTPAPGPTPTPTPTPTPAPGPTPTPTPAPGPAPTPTPTPGPGFAPAAGPAPLPTLPTVNENISLGPNTQPGIPLDRLSQRLLSELLPNPDFYSDGERAVFNYSFGRPHLNRALTRGEQRELYAQLKQPDLSEEARSWIQHHFSSQQLQNDLGQTKQDLGSIEAFIQTLDLEITQEKAKPSPNFQRFQQLQNRLQQAQTTKSNLEKRQEVIQEVLDHQQAPAQHYKGLIDLTWQTRMFLNPGSSPDEVLNQVEDEMARVLPGEVYQGDVLKTLDWITTHPPLEDLEAQALASAKNKDAVKAVVNKLDSNEEERMHKAGHLESYLLKAAAEAAAKGKREDRDQLMQLRNHLDSIKRDYVNEITDKQMLAQGLDPKDTKRRPSFYLKNKRRFHKGIDEIDAGEPRKWWEKGWLKPEKLKEAERIGEDKKIEAKLKQLEKEEERAERKKKLIEKEWWRPRNWPKRVETHKVRIKRWGLRTAGAVGAVAAGFTPWGVGAAFLATPTAWEWAGKNKEKIKAWAKPLAAILFTSFGVFDPRKDNPEKGVKNWRTWVKDMIKEARGTKSEASRPETPPAPAPGGNANVASLDVARQRRENPPQNQPRRSNGQAVPGAAGQPASGATPPARSTPAANGRGNRTASA